MQFVMMYLIKSKCQYIFYPYLINTGYCILNYINSVMSHDVTNILIPCQAPFSVAQTPHLLKYDKNN